MKRNLFAELTEGFDALKAHREGKRTLRTHAVARKPAPTVTAKELVRVRSRLKLSRAVFARSSGWRQFDRDRNRRKRAANERDNLGHLRRAWASEGGPVRYENNCFP
jgi:hypothetical protein